MPYKNLDERRAYQREWMRQRRTLFFADKQCTKCGSTENLVLHHPDPDTKESHRIWSWSQDRRDAEIAKCIVLCNNCHVKLHSDQMRGPVKPLVHGTCHGYGRWKCRCSKCQAANAARKRKWRRQKIAALA